MSLRSKRLRQLRREAARLAVLETVRRAKWALEVGVDINSVIVACPERMLKKYLRTGKWNCT